MGVACSFRGFRSNQYFAVAAVPLAVAVAVAVGVAPVVVLTVPVAVTVAVATALPMAVPQTPSACVVVVTSGSIIVIHGTSAQA